jgi:hypothetical protein
VWLAWFRSQAAAELPPQIGQNCAVTSDVAGEIIAALHFLNFPQAPSHKGQLSKNVHLTYCQSG